MKTVTLRTVTEKIGSGSTPRGGEDSYAENGTPLIRSLNVYDDGFREDGLAFLTVRQAEALSSVTVESGDVLLNITGASVARCCLAPDRLLPARVNQHVCIVRPTKAVLDSHYLQHLLIAGPTKRRLLRIGESGGATRQAITKADLQNLEIPLPALPEQKRIAAILDAADALRAKRRESIEQLDSLIQATFLEMFGDPVTNPKAWKTAPLGELCELVNGRAFKPLEWEDVGVPIIRIQNLNDSDKPFNFTSKQWPQKFFASTGDILLSWSGTPGTSFGCFRWRGPSGWVNQHIFRVAMKPDADGSYFIHAVNARLNEIIGQAHGGVGLKHITKTKLEAIGIAVPPLSIQQRFASIVESIEQQKTRLKAHLAELDTLFASLQSRAFNGELVA